MTAKEKALRERVVRAAMRRHDAMFGRESFIVGAYKRRNESLIRACDALAEHRRKHGK